jgi:hypothetical protein
MLRNKAFRDKADKNVATKPGRKPPYHELTITAAKKRGVGLYRRIGWNAMVSNRAMITVRRATP